jgi:hypothetical protein
MPGKLSNKKLNNVDRAALEKTIMNTRKPFLSSFMPSFIENLFFRFIMNKKYFRPLLYKILGKKFDSEDY